MTLATPELATQPHAAVQPIRTQPDTTETEMHSAADPAPGSDITLHDVRLELERLVSLAHTAERPKPTAINPPGHPMPGHEWTIEPRTVASYKGRRLWTIRTVDGADLSDAVYVSTEDSMYPGEDFVPLLPVDARALAMALIAAADRAEHLSAGVPRLEDRRGAAS